MRSVWRTGAVIGLVLVVAAAPSAGGQFFARVARSGFQVDGAPWFRQPFDVVAADMDLDGDPDLLVNWHHHEPLELFENTGGRFAQRNARPGDSSGLYDNSGVPYLFAAAEDMTARIEAAEQEGLYVWHDAKRAGYWRFVWRNDAGRAPGLQLGIETSLPILKTEGLEDGELEQSDPRMLRVSVPGNVKRRSFSLAVLRVATQLKLRFDGFDGLDGSAQKPAVFAGATLARLEGEVDLWKPDPHGMAWVDVQGSPRPELFITRGGLGGTLLPPAEPKVDRYYLASDAGPRLYRLASEGSVPPGYGRGRRVEWVDVEGDGTLALSVANEHTPNRLLVPDPSSGELRDTAPARGLALEGAAVQAWGDLDRDGKQDLFFLDGTRIDVMRNAKPRFERIRGDTLGLSLPPAEKPRGVIDHAALRLADFDNDGDLDLWLFGYGREKTTHLFRRVEQGFEDVTLRLGLEGASGAKASVLLDVDNDGFEDVVSFADAATLWRSQFGRGFERIGVPGSAISAATACDFDGDGWTDIVAMGRQRHLFRNRAVRGNAHLDVSLRTQGREPIGAVVRAHYGDGSVRAQRYGSAQNTAFSQSLAPLHFGIRKGSGLTAIGVRWPGQSEETLYPVRSTRGRMIVER